MACGFVFILPMCLTSDNPVRACWKVGQSGTHVDEVVVPQADGQVQGGHECSIEHVGISPYLQQGPTYLQLVLLHCPVQRGLPFKVLGIQC